MVAPNLEPLALDIDVADPDPDDAPLDTDRHQWPAFTVISYDGETIDSDEEIDVLIQRVVAAINPREKEELCIWQGGERMVGVVRSNGAVVRLDGPSPTVETHQLSQERRSGKTAACDPDNARTTQSGDGLR